MVIGIPRALIYWKRPHFWGKFFNSLGFKVLFSPLTNKEIVEMGVKRADPESCFSTKVYWGHLLWLEKKCDLIFIPRLKTNRQGFEYCPKFFGLPDLGKLLVKTPILTEVFDESKKRFEKSLENIGRKLKKGKKEVKKALNAALQEEKKEGEKIKKDFLKRMSSEMPKIVLISHPYNLYDIYVNLRIEEKLERLGTQPILIDEVSVEEDPSLVFLQKSVLDKEIIENKNISNVDFHWEFGREMLEKIREIFKYNITGIIEISSFACGCDAVLKEFIEKEVKKENIPFLYLIIDEHTAEAGIQTRLEAFIDTLQ